MARILVIDDDATFRLMLRELLEELGHAVAEANDGEAGMARCRAERFDLVITDILMPGKEGFETIQALRRMDPRVKIIAMSGGGQIGAEDYLRMARMLGARQTLEKPFQIDQLRETVDRALFD